MQLHAFIDTFRVGNFATEPNFGVGRWSDQITSKSYNLVLLKTTCESKRYKRIIQGHSAQTITPPPRFAKRPAPVSARKITTTPTSYEKDAEELDKSGMQQEKVIWIVSGSVGGFVTLLTVFLFILVRRRKAQKQREFMEDNPIYGDDYYYNPIKADEEKVEYFDVTENNVEKQNRIN